MAVLLKYLIHDMAVRYRRTLLILITLLLSSASMFTAVALSDTMVALGTAQWRAEYGYSDITITATPASPRRFFNEYTADRYGAYFEYTVRKLSSGGVLRGLAGEPAASVKGYNLEELCQMVSLHFTSQQNLTPFEGDKAIISRKTAEEYGLNTGDILTMDISGNRHAFEVCAVAYAEGPFAFETDTPCLVIPYGKMQACLGELGRVDTLYIGLKDPVTKSAVIRALSGAYANYRVSESYSEDQLRFQANRTAVPFIFMSMLLCFMAVYVLYTLFEGIVASRLPLMGIFRAMGAYRGHTHLIILAESLIYGILGGLLGAAAGMGILYGVVRMLSARSAHQYITLSVGPPQVLLSLLSAAAVSLLGASICLLARREPSICRQIRAIAPAVRSRKPVTAAGMLVLAASIAPLLLWQSTRGLVVYILCVIGMLAGLVLLSPALYGRLAGWLSLLFKNRTGPLRVALLNVKNRPDFALTAAILSIIVSTLMIITSISRSDTEGTRRYYEGFGYDIELTIASLGDGAVNRVRQIAGVDAVCANYYSSTVKVEDQSIPIYRVQGITTGHIPDFMDYEMHSGNPDPLATLSSGRYILLTQTLQGIYHAEEGDSLILKFFGRDGRYREIPYTVLGFFDDTHTKLGWYALISQDNFRSDFAAGAYDSLYIRAVDPQKAAQTLASALEKQQAVIRLVEDTRTETAAESAQIIGAMGFIANMAAACGILGIVNITLLSLMKRKREIGLYYAMGLTAPGILAVMLAELIAAGLLGSLAGTAMGLLIVFFALPRLIYALQIALTIYPDIPSMVMGLPAGLLISALSSGLCLLFMKRSNPMDGLRQEE